MPKSIEERVSYLEGAVSSNLRNIEDLRELMLQLNRRVDRLDEKVDRSRKGMSNRVGGLESSANARFENLEPPISTRFERSEQSNDTQPENMEQPASARPNAMNQRFDKFEQKMSRQFVWLVSIQVATLLVLLVGTLLSG